jgi:hypothetical protein
VLYEVGKIVSVLIHVVAGPCLSRAAVAAPIMSNDAIAALTEK